MRLLHKILLAVLLIFLGISLFINFQQRDNESKLKQELANKSNLYEEQIDLYPYLSFRALASSPHDMLINFVGLRKELDNIVNRNKTLNMGIYFEYLPTGISIGINERQNFISASLLKVPIAMAAMKEIENGNLKLDSQVTLTEDMIDNRYGELWKKGVGYEITIQEALEEMLIYSDNTAKNVLLSVAPESRLSEVFDSIDIPYEKNQFDPVVSAENYSSILRSLYLSAFLSKEDSNYILEILTRSNFPEGIPQGIPSNVRVAHKIGSHHQDETNLQELPVHTDCGIIYEPLRPYILCVMVQQRAGVAYPLIQQVSAEIYKYISTINK